MYFLPFNALKEIVFDLSRQYGNELNDRQMLLLWAEGVFGHAAGQVEGFKYSKGMEAFGAEGAVWDEATLHAFLLKPRDVVNGTKMSFAGLKEKDMAAMVAYLSTL